MQSLLPDVEQSFLGITWTTTKSSELCLITTDSRMFVPSSESLTWILKETSMRFSRPGCVFDDNTAFTIRGSEGSQKLAKFVIGSFEEILTVKLEKSVDIFEVIPIQEYSCLLIIDHQGGCEMKSSTDLVNCSTNEISSLGDGKVIKVRYFTSKKALAILFSNGSLRLIRLIPKKQQQSSQVDELITSFTLELETTKLWQKHKLSSSNTSVAAFHDEGESFGISCLDSEFGVWSFQVSFHDLSVKPLLEDDLKFPGSTCIDGAPGSRLIRFNAELSRIEAYDYIYGVLLEAWPVTSAMEIKKCNFLQISSSGRSVGFGNDKLVNIQTINIENDCSTLARALLASSLFSSQSSQDQQIQIKTSSKKRSRSSSVNGITHHSEEATEKLLKQSHSFESFSLQETTLSSAFADQLYDMLFRMIDEKILISTRTLHDSPFVEALKAGRLDFCLKCFESCSDIPAKQIVSCIRYCFDLITSQDEENERNEKKNEKKSKQKKKKEVESGMLSSSSQTIESFKQLGEGSFTEGMALFISKAITCPNLIEYELLQALSEDLTCSEETICILSSLRHVAEKVDTRSEFQTYLLSCVIALDARPIWKLKKSIRCIEEVKRLVEREILFCEKAEVCFHKLHSILRDDMLLSKQQASRDQYRIETVYL